MEADCDIEINPLEMMGTQENFPYFPEEECYDLEELSTQHDKKEGCSTTEVAICPENLFEKISLEDDAIFDQELQALRGKVGAANQVLPLITAVYENDISEATSGGLISEYKVALQDEYADSRTCLVCDSILLSPTKLFHHAVSQHKIYGLSKLIRCFVCRQLYVFGQALLPHLQEFHGLPSPHLTCCVCYCQLTSRAELKAHTRKHEQTEKCTQCFGHFASKYQLNEHTDSVHAKPFPCRSCRQGYNHETVLKLHAELHTKVEKWLCECGYRASEDVVDAELSIIKHLQVCNPASLDALLESLILENESHAKLDSLLSSYQQKSETLCSNTNQCVEDIVSSVSELLPAVPMESVLSKGDGVFQKAELMCQLCKNSLKATQCSAENVEQHMVSAHSRAKLCPFCQKRFSTASRARSHALRHARILEKNHKAPQELKCDHCDKKFTSKSRLHHHLEQQHKIAVVDKPYECPECPRKFLYPSHRDKHCARHTQSKLPGTNQAEIYRCQYCPLKFIKPTFLHRHEAKYHPKLADGQVETKHFKCLYCTEVLESLPKMRRHVVYKHGPAADKQRYQCPYCPVGCRTAAGIKNHLRVHTGERPYECSICDKAFKRTQNLTVHLRNLHNQNPSTPSTEKWFQCISCDVQLKQRSSIIKHFLHVHRQFRRFICGFCGKRFSENQQLRYHSVTTHKVYAPAIPSTNRQGQTQVYVWPGIDELPSQQRLLISKIVDDEKQKTELVPDFQVTKLKITEKPKLNGSDEKLKPKLNEKDIVEQDVDKKLLTSTTTKVTPGVPKYCMENQDFLIINDPDSTLIDQTDIKFNIDHHPSTQDAKVSSLENNTFLTEDSCVKNVNREITLGDDSSVLKTTPTVNTKSQLPLLMCNSLNSHPKQVYPTGQPINSSSECCSTATTSVLSDTAQIVPSPDLSQQLCGKNEIHKQEEAKDDESLSNPNITFKGVVQEATMIVDKTQNINNISNDKPFVTDLPQGSGINAQPKTSTQLQSKMLKCDKCDKFFTDTKRLLRHNKTHSGIHYFACDICKKTFLEKYNLSVHMRTHTGSRPFQCDECGKTMRYHQEFEDHKRVHRGEIPFICPQCPKRSFVRAKDFKRHMKSKHQPSDASWPCSLCTKFFSRKDAVEAHIKKIHNRELHPTFQCTVCEHKFLSENLLQQHRLLHSGHKGHVCTQCGKSFATKAYLQKHLRVHELRKFNVPCPNCPRTFTSNENVMIHQKTFHDKNAMLKLQAQNPQSENYSPGIPTSDCFVQVESDDNLEAELDLTQLQQLGPVDGDKDIHVVFLQVLSDANL